VGKVPAGTGMSLTELLVVVAVVLILVAVLIVGVSSTYSHAMQLKCQHRLEQIGHACRMYASAHHGAALAAWDFYGSRPWYEVLTAGGYLDDPEVTRCPSSTGLSGRGAGQRSSAMPSEVRDGVLAALRWLRDNQNSDGTWPVGDGTYLSRHVDGITGMALMCFLAYGCTTTAPSEFAETVRKGLTYLLGHQGVQGPDYYKQQHPSLGWFGNHDMYETGIGTIVASDAYALMGDLKFQTDSGEKGLKQAAQRGIEFLAEVQDSQTGAWGYGGGGTDTSISAWVTQGLAAAMRAGINVPATTRSQTDMWLVKSICVRRFACVSGLYVCSKCGQYIGPLPGEDPWPCPTPGCTGTARNGFIRKCRWSTDASTPTPDGKCPECHGPAQQVPDDYRAPYQMNRGGGPHVLRGTVDGDRRLTAMSLASRVWMGHAPNSSAAIGSPGRNCYEQLQWLKTDGSVYSSAEAANDVYVTYYTTLAMQRIGGQEWEDWKNAYIEPLLDKQNADGSWPPLAWPREAGCLTYPTALACVSLEASVGEYLPGSRWTTAAEHSYGYNPAVGLSRRTPAADTIVVIDYTLSEITAENPADCIAPRHGGKANALLGDGSVRSFHPDDISDGMWTPGPGD